GIPVAVSASPMIPALNDHELEAILEAAAAAGARHAAAIPIRLPHEVAPLFAAWLEKHLPDRKARVLAAIRAMRGGRLNDPGFGSRMKGEGEWARLLAQRLAKAKARFGLDASPPPLRKDLFARPAADPRQPLLL
ncbi:MAG: radical SAM protein, partial [Thermaurantiacus sp.]